MPLTNSLALACIHINGEQALPFLQGQVSAQVEDLNTEQGRFTVYCNRKGRVLANGWLLASKEGEGIDFVIPSSLANLISDTLNHYGRLSGVDITIEDLIPAAAPYHEANWPTLWRQGYVLIDTNTQAQFTPHMLNADKVGALCFDKGCYLGQEVIARTHYLGETKKSLHLLTPKTTNQTKKSEPPSPGSRIICPHTNTYGTVIATVEEKGRLLIAAVMPNEASAFSDWQSEGLAVDIDTKL